MSYDYSVLATQSLANHTTSKTSSLKVVIAQISQTKSGNRTHVLRFGNINITHIVGNILNVTSEMFPKFEGPFILCNI